MSDDGSDDLNVCPFCEPPLRDPRSVDVELLTAEIKALRDTATRYAHASEMDSGAAAGAGLDLEHAAIRYVRKLDEEHRRVNKVDYAAIYKAALREQDASEN